MRLAVVTAALVLAPCCSATAAPIQIAAGEASDVAVDRYGAAHVVYETPRSTPGWPIGYCRLPANASACDVSTTLPFPAAGASDFFDRGKVRLLNWGGRSLTAVAERDRVVYVSRSRDSGATWSPAEQVATGEYFMPSAVAFDNETLDVVRIDTRRIERLQLGRFPAEEPLRAPPLHGGIGDDRLVYSVNGALVHAARTARGDTLLRIMGRRRPVTRRLRGERDPEFASSNAANYLLTRHHRGRLLLRWLRFDLGSPQPTVLADTWLGDANLARDGRGRTHVAWISGRNTGTPGCRLGFCLHHKVRALRRVDGRWRQRFGRTRKLLMNRPSEPGGIGGNTQLELAGGPTGATVAVMSTRGQVGLLPLAR